MENEFTKKIKSFLEDEFSYFHDKNKYNDQDVFAYLLLYQKNLSDLVVHKFLRDDVIDIKFCKNAEISELLYQSNLISDKTIDHLLEMEYKYLQIIKEKALEEEEYEVCSNIQKYLDLTYEYIKIINKI